MKHNKFICFCCIVFLVAGCTDNRDETFKTYAKDYDDGWEITVTIQDILVTKKSILYSQDEYKFNYFVTLSPGNIQWFGIVESEPKNLILCNNNVYLRYIQHEIIKYTQHIDERYFFNLFGQQSWRFIKQSEYNKIKAVCKELLIPNFNKIKTK